MKLGPTVALVTFGLFMTEAIIHYNFGRKAASGEKGFHLPPARDLVRLGTTVGAFSILNMVIIKSIEQR